MFEAGIGNVTTKRDVYTIQLFIFGQKSDANVTDVITSTEVDGLQVGHVGQGFEAGVRDTDTETQIDRFEVGKSLSNGPEAVVGEFLTILKAEALQIRTIVWVRQVLQSLI